MALSLTEARRLIRCQKALVGVPEWERKPNRAGRPAQLVIAYRVAAEEALPQGLWFRIVSFVQFADRATFQLDLERPDSRTHDALFRLEWNPVRGHTNPFKGPPHLAGLEFAPGETHCHSALDNCVASEDRLTTGDPPIAHHVTQPVASFQDALAYICGRLAIANPGAVPSPRWQTSLFEALNGDE